MAKPLIIEDDAKDAAHFRSALEADAFECDIPSMPVVVRAHEHKVRKLVGGLLDKCNTLKRILGASKI